MAEWETVDLANPTEEHRMLREMVRDFVRKEVEPQALEYDREEKFNLNLFRKLGEYGLLGISVPAEYGGSGMDATAVAIINEELSYSDPAFCLAYLAHSQLMVNNLAFNGTEEQKARILPKVCSGEWIGCMAMSEPGYGTDVLGMQTTAEQNTDGDWVINGRKMWITNGSVDEEGTPADICWLYARTGTDAKGRAEVTTFLVEKGMPGFSVGQKIYDKSGMRASNTAELVFDDCVVPAENIVGSPGESMIHMMRNLEIERLVIAAQGLGIAGRSLRIMVDYANERKTFGRPIRDHGQVQRYIAETYAEFAAARAFVYDTARRLSLSRAGQRLDADATKLFAAQVAKRAADAAIQVLGGAGYMGEYVVQRLWRDAKLLEIGGGTLEAHHKNITKDLSRTPSLIP